MTTALLVKLVWYVILWLSAFLAGRSSVRRLNVKRAREIWSRGFSRGYGECVDDCNEAVAQRDREIAERN